MDESAAISYAPLLSNIIGQSPVAFEFDEKQFEVSSYERSTATYSKWNGGFRDAPKGSIAVIPLSGPLMKNDQFCGPRGMATIGSIIKEADNSDNIDGIILKIDSPGGTADGTSDLAEIVKGTSKPIIAFADGLIASAALWIGASADEIIAANNKTQIGSIGVILSFADLQPAYEKLGVKFHNVVADQSKDKNKMWQEIQQGKYDNYKKEVLNPLAEDFINHIKENLPNVKNDQLTGSVFFAENVIGSLVNSVGNFDYAIERLTELIDENKSNTNSKNNTATMKKFKAIDKVVGADLQTTDEGAHLNNDQLESINSSIEQGATDAAALETATAAQATAETAQATAEANLVTANETIATLKDKPGAESAVVITGSDKVIPKDGDKNVTNDSKGFMENVDAIEAEFLG